MEKKNLMYYVPVINFWKLGLPLKIDIGCFLKKDYKILQYILIANVA